MRSVPSWQAFCLSFVGMSRNSTLDEDELSPDLADGLASRFRQLRARPGADEDNIGIGLPVTPDLTTNSSIASVAHSAAAALGATFADVIQVPLWGVFGDFDVEHVETVAPRSSAILWVYILVSNLVLVNLLVAMVPVALELTRSSAEQFYSPSPLLQPIAALTRMSLPPTAAVCRHLHQRSGIRNSGVSVSEF